MLDPAKKILQQRKIKDRLGNGVLTADFEFVFETPDFLIEIGHATVRPYADHKIRACANRVSANIEAKVQVVYDVHQPDCVFFFQAEDGIRDADVTGVQTCALPI